jgi:hypothetical protein
MPVKRGQNTKQVPLKMVGSSVFGLYEKMDSQKTYNMTISDGWLVPYPGYKIGVESTAFQNAMEGRGLYESVKLNSIIGVFDSTVYKITLQYDHQQQKVLAPLVSQLGQLQTSNGVVYISENNKPQILISDNSALYLYDPNLSVGTFDWDASVANTITITGQYLFAEGEPITLSGASLPTGLNDETTYYIFNLNYDSTTDETTFQLALSIPDINNDTAVTFPITVGIWQVVVESNFFIIDTLFTPGYINFHDTYFLAAASDDTFYSPPANNTWRLSSQNNGFLWFDIAQTVGLLETKPDNTQAVVRFPSKGNMILVMGETVTEFWYDTGAQLFPYQRQNQSSIDYGCLNPATVASMDEVVVWLARNEKSGPVIMYTTGGMPEKITTDGIDYQLSEIDNPQSAQGFLYRKNGHLFYHLNFYEDNISFVVDFNTKQIFNASDHNMNYYIMGQVVWFNNQYFSITKDNGNLFVFDTIFTTYDNVLPNGTVETVEIPRIRVCDNIRLPSQDYFIFNDVGFTIETGFTDYQLQQADPLPGFQIGLLTEEFDVLITEDEEDTVVIIEEQLAPNPDPPSYIQSVPRVDLSISYDGGASFSSYASYELNPIGKRKNRLMWWQLGIANDAVCQFRFWGIGRFVCTDGIANIRI